MQPRLNRKTFVFVLFPCFVIGCMAPNGDQPDSGRTWLDGGEVDGGTFRKPVTNHTNPREYDGGKVRSDGMGYSLWLRDYVSDPGANSTAYLFYGEYFALDGSISFAGENIPSTVRVGVRVFVDFRPVPFHLSRVTGPSDWTSRSNFSSLSYRKQTELRVPEGERYFYSLVVPPDALGSRGAHDLRIVFFRKFAPNTDENVHWDYRGFNEGYHLKYGGYRAEDDAERFPELETATPSGDLTDYVLNGGVFLFPEHRRTDFTDTSKFPHAGLGERVDLRRSSQRLTALVTESGARDNLGGRNYYAVLKDGNLQTDLTGVGRTKDVPDGFGSRDDWPNGWANELPIPVSDPDGTEHSIRVLSFPKPYRDWRKTDSLSSGRISNVIFYE